MRPIEQFGKYVDEIPAETELPPGLKLLMILGMGLLGWAVTIGVIYVIYRLW